MKMEVWQGKGLRACFSDVWQMKALGKWPAEEFAWLEVVCG